MISVQRFFNRGLQSFTASINSVQVRCMSKYLSKSARKRLPLTTKRASRGGFYKGKGATKEGRLTSKGKFIVNPLKRLELVVPDLTGFKLKPYIAASVHKHPPEKRRNNVQTWSVLEFKKKKKNVKLSVTANMNRLVKIMHQELPFLFDKHRVMHLAV